MSDTKIHPERDVESVQVVDVVDDQVTTSSGSSPLSSVTGASNSLTGVKNPLDPSLFFSSDAIRALPFSEAPAPVKLLRLLHFVRGIPEPNFPLFVISVFICVTFAIGELAQTFLVWRGHLGVRWILYILRSVEFIGPPFAPIFFTSFLMVLSRNPVGASNIAITAVGVFACCTLVFDWGHNVIFFFDFLPSMGFWSESCARLRYLRAIIITSAVIIELWVNKGTAPGASFANKVAMACIFAGFITIDWICHLAFVPYFKKRCNELRIAIATAALEASLIQIAAVIAPSSVSVYLLISAVVLMIPAGFGGILLMRLRLRGLNKKADAINLATQTPTPGVPVPSFRWPFQYELAAKKVYSIASPTEEDISRAEYILLAGTKRFPGSAYLRISLATLMLEARHNAEKAKKLLVDAARRRPPLDLDFQVYALLCSSTGRDSKSDDASTDLTIAKLHHSAAKKAIADFWQKVYRMRRLDAESLFSTISSLDHHETAAAGIFQQLVSDHPNSLPILRAYAFFLQDIKGEMEQADTLFSLADEIEDAQSKGRKHKQKEVAFTERRTAKEPEESEAGDAGVEGAKLRTVDSQSTIASSAGSMLGDTSENRAKILHYKSKIASSRSSAVRKMKAAQFLSFAAVFVLMIGVCVAALVTTSNVRAGHQLILASQSVGFELVEDLLRIRILEFNTSSEFTFSELEEDLSDLAENWRFIQLNGIHRSWLSFGNQITVKNWISGGALNASDLSGRRLENVSVLSAIETSIFFLSQTASADSTTLFAVLSGNVTIERTQAGRFLLDNLAQVIADSILPFVDESVAIVSGSGAKSATVLGQVIGVPCGIVLVMLSVFVFFVPNVMKLKAERISAVNLFMDLPKSTCVNVMQSVAAEKQKLEEKYKATKVSIGERNGGVIRRLTVSFIVLLTGVALCGVAVLVGVVLVTSRSDEIGEIAPAASSRATKVTLLMNLVNELAIQDPSVWENQTITAEFGDTVRELQAASDHLRVTHKEASVIPEIERLLYSQPCPEELGCAGLLQTLEVLTKYSQFFLSMPQSERTVMNPYLRTCLELFSTAEGWLEERNEAQLQDVVRRANGLDIVVAIAISASVCFLVAALIISRPLLRALEIETTRGMQLLLGLPLNVLLAVDSIRDFLESGTIDDDTSKNISADQEQSTKVILDGSRDAVIMCNESLAITLFNQSAEELLGYQAAEVLGTSIFLLLDSATAGYFKSEAEMFLKDRRDRRRHLRRHASQFTFGDSSTELAAIRKDKAKIPVLMSAVSAVSSNGIIFATFLKDIRSIKEHEAELQAERRRADLLLRSIFPATIVDTLKTCPGKQVAERFTGVTVVFIDIVEFTPTAAGMSPEALVGMLNGVFTRWDEIAVEHGVEKVKTIGDCWMGACGVPVPRTDHAKRVVEFAIDALNELAEFNKESKATPLSVRIGINTGNVIAGIIGKTKPLYDMWGDAVNVAARVETNGIPNRIQVSSTTREELRDKFVWESRGKIPLKGKGEHECFLLVTPTPVGKREQSARAVSRGSTRTNSGFLELFCDTKEPGTSAAPAASTSTAAVAGQK